MTTARCAQLLKFVQKECPKERCNVSDLRCMDGENVRNVTIIKRLI